MHSQTLKATVTWLGAVTLSMAVLLLVMTPTAAAANVAGPRLSFKMKAAGRGASSHVAAVSITSTLAHEVCERSTVAGENPGAVLIRSHVSGLENPKLTESPARISTRILAGEVAKVHVLTLPALSATVSLVPVHPYTGAGRGVSDGRCSSCVSRALTYHRNIPQARMPQKMPLNAFAIARGV